MPNTPRGITYPAESDHTRLWEHLQDLAETVDSAISALLAEHIQIGTATIPITAVNTVATVDVAFDHPFTTAPQVFLSLLNVAHATAQFMFSPGLITVNGFQARGTRTVGTGAYQVMWAAIAL